MLWLFGGLSFGSLLAIPGIPHAHPLWILILGVGATLFGVFLIVASGLGRVSWRGLHLAVAAAYPVIATAVASSGGAESPAWSYLFFAGLFSAYFFPRRLAIAYLMACVVTHAFVIVYDRRVLHDVLLAQLIVGTAGYTVLGAAIIAGRERLWRLRNRAEQLAAEQGSLRRVATAVVSGRSADQIYALVAFEMAALVEGGAAGILRLDSSTQMTVMGSWADHPGGCYEPGTLVEIRSGTDVERALETNQPVRVAEHPADSPVGQLGYRSSIVAPIQVAGRTWGVLAVTAGGVAHLTDVQEGRLMTFGDLLGTAIGAIEDRAKLAAQASSDPLTGLANHRTLRKRLRENVETALATGRPLSVVVLDIDDFKQINDAGGHEAGDEILKLVANCLARVARGADTLGRAGGDEFTWLLPNTSADEALAATERVRRLMAAAGALGASLVTLSTGICDTRWTHDPAELMRLADGALYWSKAHGRNQCRIYDPAVVSELSADQRAERLERSQALVGLRALATAIDAKDPATREHSERVSELAGKLAREAGWPTERARQLSEAALVHDVGKIGVPDAVLRKTTPLTDPEWEQIRAHADLAARIVDGVLSPEQVEWIRTHHERPDGGGYPRHLAGDAIPEGASLLAIADAWDVMTVSRPYSRQKTADEALDECVTLAGAQFTDAAVAALLALYESGELIGDAGDRPSSLTAQAA